MKKRSREDAPDVLAKFKTVLEPDDDLSEAVRRFASWYYRVSDAVADARNAEGRCKDEYDSAWSAAEVRLHGSETKRTVAQIKAMCEQSASVMIAARNHRHAREHTKKLEALLAAYEKKSSMLKAEVELVSAAYVMKDSARPRTRKY